MQGIYEIINLMSGDSYVGSSVDIKARWNSHVLALQGKYHNNQCLQKAWDEYGEGAFSFCVLEQIQDVDDLRKREQVWLDRAFEAGGTYNIAGNANALPGSRGPQLTEQEIAHCREVAQRAMQFHGSYYGAAKALGDKNLRAGIRRLLTTDYPPSEYLHQALLDWEKRPIIIEVGPGNIVIDEEGLLGSGEPIGGIWILPLEEVLPHLRNCARCGQQMLKWSRSQKYCSRCKRKA